MDESNSSELPRGQSVLSCECGYQSARFGCQDHVYRCTACRGIVFPEPVPFLYAAPRCPHCQSQLGPEDRILTERMHDEDRVACPRCAASSLKLCGMVLQLFSAYRLDATPEVGQLLHAQTRRPQFMCEPFGFWSPRLLRELALGVTIVNIARETLPDGHHEFRTVSVASSHLVVEYLRELSEAEWRWYTG